MNGFRPWAPAAVAGIPCLLVLAIGTHTGLKAPRLMPSVEPVTVRGRDVADFAAEVSAPLFSNTRTIAPPASDIATPAIPPPTLTGVVIAGSRAVALLKGTTDEAVMLHVGETIDGWVIDTISNRSIVVTRGGDRETVAMTFGGSSRSAKNGAAETESSRIGATASDDGLAVATKLGLPDANIPRGSPLAPPAIGLR